MNTAGGELLRKSVHISMGGFALLLRFLTPGQAALCAGIALTFNLFVLHRDTGEPVFPVEERPVPPSDVPGETAWPWLTAAASVLSACLNPSLVSFANRR